MIPLVGFLPAEDPRVRGTVAAIERELLVDGLVQRYPTESGVDGLPPGEGLFLACSFWLVDNLVLLGRGDEARRLYDRLLALRNDVGLLAEQYDPRARRQLGNFPRRSPTSRSSTAPATCRRRGAPRACARTREPSRRGGTAAAIRRRVSSISAGRRTPPRPEEAAETVAPPPRHHVHVQMRHALAHPVVDRHEGAVGAERRLHRPRDTRTASQSGAVSAAGRSPMVSTCSRGITRQWPGKSGR